MLFVSRVVFQLNILGVVARCLPIKSFLTITSVTPDGPKFFYADANTHPYLLISIFLVDKLDVISDTRIPSTKTLKLNVITLRSFLKF